MTLKSHGEQTCANQANQAAQLGQFEARIMRKPGFPPAMGNFVEIYERNLGEDSPYKPERGLNNLWSNGGVLFTSILD